MTDVMEHDPAAPTAQPARLGIVTGPGTSVSAGGPHGTVALMRALDVIGIRPIQAPALDDLLDGGMHGVILASPTSYHLPQALAAIERGIAVFCQRPLACDARETRTMIDAARTANVLLGVDMSLRQTEAMRVLRSTVQAGELGDIYAVELIYHNALGPENAWTADPSLAGGGCVLDSGMVLIDLTLWALGFPQVTDVSSRLFCKGDRILRPASAADTSAAVPIVEDYASAILDLDTGATVHLACSWDLPAGQNARIEVTFYGTDAGGTLRNIDGSYHDFTAEIFRGPSRHVLSRPPDAWAGRGVVAWADALGRGARYDPWVEGVIDVARAVDRIAGKL